MIKWKIEALKRPRTRENTENASEISEKIPLKRHKSDSNDVCANATNEIIWKRKKTKEKQSETRTDSTDKDDDENGDDNVNCDEGIYRLSSHKIRKKK